MGKMTHLGRESFPIQDPSHVHRRQNAGADGVAIATPKELDRSEISLTDRDLLGDKIQNTMLLDKRQQQLRTGHSPTLFRGVMALHSVLHDNVHGNTAILVTMSTSTVTKERRHRPLIVLTRRPRQRRLTIDIKTIGVIFKLIGTNVHRLKKVPVDGCRYGVLRRPARRRGSCPPCSGCRTGRARSHGGSCPPDR